MVDIREAFTIGEMADMLGINKQTLTFYCQKGLLSPHLVNQQNKYTYYTIREYHILEIILKLRHLDFSVQEIKDYLQHRSPVALHEIIQRKQKEYRDKIEYYHWAGERLQSLEENACKMNAVILDTVMLEAKGAMRCAVSPDIAVSASSKERVRNWIEFTEDLVEGNYFTLGKGWMIAEENIYKREYNVSVRHVVILTEADFPEKYQGLSLREFPPHMYCSICTKGNYHQIGTALYEKLFSFMELNHLRLSGDALVLQLRDYWYVSDSKQYIVKILLPVVSASEG